MKNNIILDVAAAPIFQNTGAPPRPIKRRKISAAKSGPQVSEMPRRRRLRKIPPPHPEKQFENDKRQELTGSLRIPAEEQNPAAVQDANYGNSDATEQQDQDTQEENEDKEFGQDEQDQNPISKRAEKMADDPYMTQSQMRNVDTGSKEKQSKSAVEEEGKNDSKKRKGKEKDEQEKNQRQLDNLSSRANIILLKAKGVFPFDFFPDTLTIDANKVNIINKTFFASESVVSVMIKEIMDVRVETAIFLGRLLIDYGPHPLKIHTVTISSLRRQDALRAKDILEGMLVIYRGENIDITKLKPEETLQEIEDIGKVDDEEGLA